METDWKKKYEEALERMKYVVVLPKNDQALQAIKETVFPELAESEDEKTRKEIIDWMKGGNTYDWQKNKEKWISYLEKQKERKPELPKPHKGDDTNPYDMSVSEAQEYAINRGFGIPFNDGEVYVDERYITQTIGNILRWADEHPKEQKPAEWSEQDIQYYDAVMDMVMYAAYLPSRPRNEVIKWLRERFKNLVTRSRWKPSEEQMRAFHELLGGKVPRAPELYELYNDLEKLM